MEMNQWSRLKGFFNLSIGKRRELLKSLPLSIKSQDFSVLDRGLSLADADLMSENVIGVFSLPLSLAANFIVDETPVLIPMVTEEPSIVAACSKMAKLTARCGGFVTEIDRSLIKGQIQIYQLSDVDKAIAILTKEKEGLLHFAKSLCPNMEARGGGVTEIGFRVLPSQKIGPMVIIEPVIDVVDAMGANAVNSLLESLAKKIKHMIDGNVGLRILSNLCDQRLARASAKIACKQLALDPAHDDGEIIAEKIIAAHAFAEADRYRACTHNKGILNGIDAVAIATGNDFRAIEASAHAYASLNGSYEPLTKLTFDVKNKLLHAQLTLPLAVGVVGGITGIHDGVRFSHKVLDSFAMSSKKLASVMVSVGLAQCLAALLALSVDGIQQGHMKLHKKKTLKTLKEKDLNN